MSEIIWQFGDPEAWYHDLKCPCVRHCGYCWSDLTKLGYHPLARYCSDYCKYLAKRERAVDRVFKANLAAHVANCSGCDLHQ